MVSEETLREWTEQAENGDISAMLHLALAEDSMLLEDDDAAHALNAFKWAYQAAKSGNALGMYLALLHAGLELYADAEIGAWDDVESKSSDMISYAAILFNDDDLRERVGNVYPAAKDKDKLVEYYSVCKLDHLRALIHLHRFQEVYDDTGRAQDADTLVLRAHALLELMSAAEDFSRQEEYFDLCRRVIDSNYTPQSDDEQRQYTYVMAMYSEMKRIAQDYDAAHSILEITLSHIKGEEHVTLINNCLARYSKGFFGGWKYR